MAWYYYSGSTILSVPVGKGEVLAVRPHTTIFVDPSVEGSAAFKRFSNVLRRSGAPKGAKPILPAQPIAADTIASGHLMSDSFIEGKAVLANNAQTPIAIAAKHDAAIAQIEVAPVVEVEVVETVADEPSDAAEVVEEQAEDADAAPTRRKRTTKT